MSNVQHRLVAEFNAAPSLPYVTLSGVAAGMVRTATDNSGGAGNYTFVRVYDAG